MIDRLAMVHEGEQRFMCPRNRGMHADDLDGVPEGAVLTAKINGIGEVLSSAFRERLAVSIDPEPGTCLHGNANRDVSKTDFVNLPQNRRHVTFDETSKELTGSEIDYAARYMSEGRANEITYAVYMAVGHDAKFLRNPFRTGDKTETAEMLAMLADYKSSGVHGGGSWISNFQSRESAMSVNHEHGVHLDTSKFANADAEWYRKLISEAVARLLSAKKPTREDPEFDEFTIS